MRGLPSAAPAGKARHVGKAQLREGTVRAPRSVVKPSRRRDHAPRALTGAQQGTVTHGGERSRAA